MTGVVSQTTPRATPLMHMEQNPQRRAEKDGSPKKKTTLKHCRRLGQLFSPRHKGGFFLKHGSFKIEKMKRSFLQIKKKNRNG
jgi:hypothetical protein